MLGRKGVRLHLGVAVTEVGAGHVTLADGTALQTRCVVWGGGIKAPPVAAAAGLPPGRGGRIDVRPDLTVAGSPGVYVVGDMANIPSPDGDAQPQLGSVALQSGAWAAENILADAAGKPRKPLPLPRQGHHGDDRPRRRDRRGRRAPPRAARRDRVLRLARASTPR